MYMYQITHSYPRGGDDSWEYPVPDPARRRPRMVPGSFVVLVVECC